MTQDKKAEKLDWMEVGSSIHTALRKLCDGKGSSFLYNIIHVMPEGMWGAVLRYLTSRFEKEGITVLVVKSALTNQFGDANWNGLWRDLRDNTKDGATWMNLISMSCELMEEDEWISMLGYLVDPEEDEDDEA